jgi:hypothetical protein
MGAFRSARLYITRFSGRKGKMTLFWHARISPTTRRSDESATAGNAYFTLYLILMFRMKHSIYVAMQQPHNVQFFVAPHN